MQLHVPTRSGFMHVLPWFSLHFGGGGGGGGWASASQP